jgi:hypothetical protein
VTTRFLTIAASLLLWTVDGASGASAQDASKARPGPALAQTQSPNTGRTLAPPDLVEPSRSLVHFEGTDQSDVSHFHGRFVLRGTFHYFSAGHRQPAQLVIVPDPEIAAVLPRWVSRDGDGPDAIYIYKPEPFVRAHIPAAKTAVMLRDGGEIKGRAEIEVDSFTATYLCKGQDVTIRYGRYTARYTGSAKLAPAPRRYASAFPCGD